MHTDLPPGSGQARATLFSNLRVPTPLAPSARGTTSSDLLCVPRQPYLCGPPMWQTACQPRPLCSCLAKPPLPSLSCISIPPNRVTRSQSSLSLGAPMQSLGCPRLSDTVSWVHAFPHRLTWG